MVITVVIVILVPTTMMGYIGVYYIGVILG